jgi:hypothetical protein
MIAGAVVTSLCGLALLDAGSALAETKTLEPGGETELTLPAGVTSIAVEAFGGSGQNGEACEGGSGGAGRFGALVTATLKVSGGSALHAHFGGGGPGGYGDCVDGGSGGGRSELDSSEALVVAGGGGGGGGGRFVAGGEGGSAQAGKLAGGGGSNGDDFPVYAGGGGAGGGESSPGKGGAAGTEEEELCEAGEKGSATSGGGGGGPGFGDSCEGGGGGGGGYRGGGGGGSGTSTGGGGGAGSSYIDTAEGSGSVAVNTGGEKEKIVITYTVPAPPTAKISSPETGGIYKQGEVIRTKFSCSEGAGGTELASCKDEDGVPSSEEGTLETTMLGSHTYTVTAKSKDGLEGSAKIEYSVIPAPAACKAAEGAGTYKKRGEPGRLNLRDKLSTNTSEAQSLLVSTESGAVHFGLNKLTSASCGVVEGGFAFSGEGPARNYKTTGYTIHFSISVIKGKTYFSSTLTKGSEKIHEAVGEPLSKSNEVIH